ncbi:hypothetical protein FIBSPDRAFT_544709 [Athelia psychrophila]|uniref:F-box domain-containing protein n=1 Tax=Athelia psychrophila TaxID=1759441 RepID=A0A166IUW6_9AGAM|nr:hypothetical protein FIBSPDRAFT_544709 [Fibularhizoctonia sp. CBS 109695]
MLESLPPEIISDILSELDLASLVTISYLSRRLRSIASDSSLNPWRRPILRNLESGAYEPSLKNLCVRTTVPRQNWIEILSLARAEYLLFEVTLPNLKSFEWEECFRRRFLPGWSKRKKVGSQWKAVFLQILHRVWHRSHTPCTSDEAWTKYIVLNRNGSANELEGSSRNFSPWVIFETLKEQSNLSHLETRIRVVAEFADVRILAFGVLNQPKTIFINPNAHALLHPPGIGRSISSEQQCQTDPLMKMRTSKPPVLDFRLLHYSRRNCAEYHSASPAYSRLTRPLPSPSHINYPFYTPGGKDKRWIGSGELEEDGLRWVGGLMLTAQLIGPLSHESYTDGPPLQDMGLVTGTGRNQYAPLCWEDVRTIAPWLEISKIIYGPGLGT